MTEYERTAADEALLATALAAALAAERTANITPNERSSKWAALWRLQRDVWRRREARRLATTSSRDKKEKHS